MVVISRESSDRTPAGEVMGPRVFTVDLSRHNQPPSLPEPTTSIEEAIALTGHGRFHRLLLVCCGMALASVIAITVNTSYVLPSAGCEFLMSSRDKGLLNAMCYIGMICSSHLWGYLADTRGRKCIIMAGFLMDTVCTVISSFAHSYWLYLVLRFFNGFAINATAAINYVYLGEFHPDATRTQAIMWCGVFVSLAGILLPGVAWLVIPQQWSVPLPAYNFSSWRMFLVLCCTPSLLSAALFTLLPESPKFLLARGRHKEALAVLRHMYCSNTGKPADTYHVRGLSLSESTAPQHPEGTRSQSIKATAASVWRQTAPLFCPPHCVSTAVIFLLMFAFFCIGNGVMLWLPEIFNTVSRLSSSAEPRGPMTVCDAYRGGVPGNDTDNAASCAAGIDPVAFQNTLVAGGVSCVMYLAAGTAVRFVSRSKLALSMLVVAAASGLGLEFVGTPLLVTACACLLVSVLFTGISVASSFIVDVFPTHLRGMAMSLGLMAGRIGTVGGNLILGAMLENDCDALFYFIAATCLGCAILTFLLPEKK